MTKRSTWSVTRLLLGSCVAVSSCGLLPRGSSSDDNPDLSYRALRRDASVEDALACADGTARGDGGACVEIDPCREVTCGANAHCDLEKPTQCRCDKGYQGDGLQCEPMPTEALAMCESWNATWASTVYGWSGAESECGMGTVSEEDRSSGLAVANAYRALAGLPAAQRDETLDQKAQACAVMLRRSGELTHTPPPDTPCYTEQAGEAALNSNLWWDPAARGSAAGVRLAVWDPGNEESLGHRRWLLSNLFGPTGFGVAGQYTCVWVVGREDLPLDAASWVAWPPAGFVPLGDVFDDTGWSFQSDFLEPLGVTVSAEGVELPVMRRSAPARQRQRTCDPVQPRGLAHGGREGLRRDGHDRVRGHQLHGQAC